MGCARSAARRARRQAACSPSPRRREAPGRIAPRHPGRRISPRPLHELRGALALPLLWPRILGASAVTAGCLATHACAPVDTSTSSSSRDEFIHSVY